MALAKTPALWLGAGEEKKNSRSVQVRQYRHDFTAVECCAIARAATLEAGSTASLQ